MGSFILVGLALLVTLAITVAYAQEPESDTIVIRLPKQPPRQSVFGTFATLVVVLLIVLYFLQHVSINASM
jgi:uncharacterized protein HemY